LTIGSGAAVAVSTVNFCMTENLFGGRRWRFLPESTGPVKRDRYLPIVA
jgi:hypothetical protein